MVSQLRKRRFLRHWGITHAASLSQRSGGQTPRAGDAPQAVDRRGGAAGRWGKQAALPARPPQASRLTCPPRVPPTPAIHSEPRIRTCEPDGAAPPGLWEVTVPALGRPGSPTCPLTPRKEKDPPALHRNSAGVTGAPTLDSQAPGPTPESTCGANRSCAFAASFVRGTTVLPFSSTKHHQGGHRVAAE